MRRKMTVFAVVLALLLTLSPALGLEPLKTQFADVAPEAWYADGVTTCANAGIMVGDGAGLFHPEARLTQAECLTLALRLYAPDVQLEKAPDDWGKITLTLADGTTLEGYGYGSYPLPGVEGGSFAFGESGASSAGGSSCLTVTLTGELEACEGWAKAHEGKGSVKVGDLTLPGTVSCWIDGYLDQWVLSFHPDNGWEGSKAILLDVLPIDAPSPACWYRDVYYTAQRLGLKVDYAAGTGYDGVTELMRSPTAQWWATREQFAHALAEVAEGYSLTQRFQVADLPDRKLDRDQFSQYPKTLYEGGILNGVDKFGAFDGDGLLTRAEAAVMVARLLDPDLRLTEPPAPLPNEGYILTETTETWDQVYGPSSDDLGPELTKKRGENGLYGYVDRQGDWVILPKWADAQGFLDGFASVSDGTLRYAIDDMGRDVLGRGYFTLDNLGEGKFLTKRLEPGKGYIREVVDVEGATYPTPYGHPWLTFHNGCGVFCPSYYRTEGFYVDSKFRPVSRKFDRCGALDENLSGLVELDGKIYRIQFD